MPEIIHDCPRCGIPHTTFDVKGAHLLSSQHTWQEVHELFSICRACAKSSTLVVQTKEPRGYGLMQGNGGIGKTPGVLNHIVRVIGLVSTKDRLTTVPPDYLPAPIDAAFREGAACHSIGCINAAAAMFRLCVDLATSPLVPTSEGGGPLRTFTICLCASKTMGTMGCTVALYPVQKQKICLTLRLNCFVASIRRKSVFASPGNERTPGLGSEGPCHWQGLSLPGCFSVLLIGFPRRKARPDPEPHPRQTPHHIISHNV